MRTMTVCRVIALVAWTVAIGAYASAETRKALHIQLQPGALTAVAANAVSVAQLGAPSPSAATGEGATKEADERKVEIDEIIVTAQKREQKLSDVPMSIGVVTADDIDRRGLVSSEDYLRGIPGVNQVEGGSLGQGIIIRGLETQTSTQNITSGATVATYFGETPTTSTAGVTASTGIDLKLVDIERVEVLRGPQGTAFGNASLGGAVRTIPVAPKLNHVEGKLSAGYGVTSGTGGDSYDIQAVGNLPLISDKLAVRAVGYLYKESGFYRNRAGSDPAFQAAVAAVGSQVFAIDEDEVGGSIFTGGRLSAVYQPVDALKFTLSYLAQKTESDGLVGATSGTYTQTILQVAPEHRRRGETGVLFDTDIDIANAIVEYDLGWGNLLAIYSHTTSGSDGPYGYTVFGPDLRSLPLSAGFHNDHREHVGEVRLATGLDGPWNGLIGLYIEDVKDAGGENYIWHGDPALVLPFFGQSDPFLGGFLDQRTTKQKAAFGEVSWEFMPRWTLNSGVRAYDYDRTYQNDASGVVGGYHVMADTKASGELFRANLSYKLDNGLLYGGWAQGFRLGRPQVAPLASACDVNADGFVNGTNVSLQSLSSLNSDSVDNYEIGGKFALLSRRLNVDAAIFRMKWSDIPFRAFPLDPNIIGLGCLQSIQFTNAGTVANVGEARSDGVEAQANFQLTEAFRLDLGGSYINAKLTEDAPAPGFLSGQRLPGAPKVNANLGLEYRFGVAGHQVSVRTDALYVGAFNTIITPPALTTGNNNEAGDYVKLDASARMTFDHLKVDLFVHNVTSEDAFTYRWVVNANDPFYGMRLRPRTVGMQLSYDFR